MEEDPHLNYAPVEEDTSRDTKATGDSSSRSKEDIEIVDLELKRETSENQLKKLSKSKFKKKQDRVCIIRDLVYWECLGPGVMCDMPAKSLCP